MRPSVRRVPTPGVLGGNGIVRHPHLDCAAPAGSAEALELGLESERVEVVAGGRRLTLPPWLTSSAIPLPPGIGRAVLATLGHQASGMAPLLLGSVVLLAVGAATASLGLVALAALGVALLGSVLVHELGHVVAYRALVGPAAPALVVVRGAACHVVRRADGDRVDLAVVVAGGAAPVVLTLVALPAAAVAPVPVLLGALVALGHLAALALPFGDGASLRSIVAGRRRRRDAAATVVAVVTRRRSRPRAGSSRRARSPGTAGRSAGA